MKLNKFVNHFFVIVCIVFSILDISAQDLKKEFYFYVGSYTTEGGKGIYLYSMDSESGKIKQVSVTENVINPSYLAINKNTGCLYSVNEISDYEETNSGSITAFKINPQTKDLIFINKKSSYGADPCFITVDEKNNLVLTTNYSSGSISLNPVDAKTGELKDTSDFIQDESLVAANGKMKEPHAHSINLDNQNKYAYAVDLGIDKIFVYKIDKAKKKLLLNSVTKVEPGAGPRHFTITDDGKFAYVINELNSTIISFRINNKNGSLDKLETYSTLPDDFTDTSYCAEIHIHPNGKFLYGSNRGHNSIVIFRINKENGKLTRIGFESTQGNWPRNFVIDPTGKYLLAANQKSNNITVFKINPETGILEYTGISESVPSPVCLLFYDK